MNESDLSGSLRRIADALEAIAAAQTHKMHDEFLRAAATGKNDQLGKELVRRHPCPVCKKA